MRSTSISDDDLVDALGEVFSRHGVDGASLTRLSEASGLQRASLYHRFPGGKDAILDAVIARTSERFDATLAPAFEDGDARQRADRVAAAIDDYYDRGERSCLLVALSVAEAAPRGQGIGCVDTWIAAFERLATDAGQPTDRVTTIAAENVALIEGSLVIAQITGDTSAFRRAVDSLAERLTDSS